MVFDGHSDLLYDVARRRLAGERRVLETHHLDTLRRGGVEGLVLALWANAPAETFWRGTAWADPADFRGRTEQLLRCGRADLAESGHFRTVRTVREAERTLAYPAGPENRRDETCGNPNRLSIVASVPERAARSCP